MNTDAVILAQRLLNAVIMFGAGGIVISLIIHAMFEREMENLLGAAGIALVLVLSGLGIAFRDGEFAPIIAIALILLFVAWRVGQAAETDVVAARLLTDDERTYLQAIERDYNNAAAHAFLAAVYDKQGRMDEAIEHYQVAARLDRQDLKSRLRAQALQRRLRAVDALAPRCPRCDTPMRADPRLCYQCGWRRTLRAALIEMRGDGSLRRGLIYLGAYSAAAMALSFGFHASFSLGVSVITLGWVVGFALLMYLAMWPAGAPHGW